MMESAILICTQERQCARDPNARTGLKALFSREIESEREQLKFPVLLYPDFTRVTRPAA